MEITNFDLESKGKSQHHWLLPTAYVALSVDLVLVEKTNLTLNLLLKVGYINYDWLHIYSKTTGQEKYQFLSDWTEVLEKFAKKEVASFHSSVDDIIPADKLNSKECSIMVFDDVMIEKQGADREIILSRPPWRC